MVCAKEGSSHYGGRNAFMQGLRVSYLKGGMKAWSEHLEPVKVGDLNNGGEMYISLSVLEKVVYLIWLYRTVKQQLLMPLV